MFKVLCDNALMCDSRIEELALINPVVTLEENKAGSFSFILPPKHPFYETIQKRKTIVEVYQDEDLIFSGMCIEATTDFYKQKSIYCEGELTYFNDSIQRPARYQNVTVRGLLETLIANHNSQVEESKQFTVGMVTVTDPNNSLYCYTNMENTMTCLKEDLVDDLGGIIRIRHENGVKYVDYLAESPNTNSQTIRLGENLVDFTSNIDATDIATAIIPLGAKVEEVVVEDLETRLTIESVNAGKDYVYNQDAVNAYGWIYKTIEFDDVTTATALKTKGEKYLTETQYENVVIEAKAIDLHLTDSAIERFKLSDQIRVVSAPHGLDKYFRLTKQTLNLNNPASDTITLGKTEKLSLSAQSSKVSDAVRNVVKSITPPSKIVQQAVENATALITSAMGGYVVKTNNELLIMDTDDIETATKVWRWNINGLGYSSTGYNGEYALAMTMDGSIVADFITTGCLSADLIKSGTMTGERIHGGSMVLTSTLASSAYGLKVEATDSGNPYFKITPNCIQGINSNGNNTFVAGSDNEGYFSLFNDDESNFTNISASSGIYMSGVIFTKGNLVAEGTKNRLVETENYNKRLLYCYETSFPLFGDVGEGEIDDTGKCYIWLDDVFTETVDIECQYQVFLQPYGTGQCYVSERTPSYFVVEGTENIKFGWELKAIQKDYDSIRLEERTEEQEMQTNEAADVYGYLSSLLYDTEREVA